MVAADLYAYPETTDPRAPERARWPVAEALQTLMECDDLEAMNRYTFMGRMLDLLPIEPDAHGALALRLRELYDILKADLPAPAAEKGP